MIALIFWVVLIVAVVVDLIRAGFVGERAVMYVLFALLGVGTFGLVR